MDLYEEKKLIVTRMTLISLNEVFPIKTSEFEISHSVEGYDEKTAKINEFSTMRKSA